MRADVSLKTPAEWLRTQKFEGYKIVQPHGWTSGEDPKPLSEKIHLSEFVRRLMDSEVSVEARRGR